MWPHFVIRSAAPCSGRRARAAALAVIDLVSREDRDLEGHVFDAFNPDRLRTAIGRACKAAGVPSFSPHDLRHRRLSLEHLRGEPWARIGEFVGQRNLAVTANTYTHVLSDETELDYAELLSAILFQNVSQLPS